MSKLKEIGDVACPYRHVDLSPRQFLWVLAFAWLLIRTMMVDEYFDTLGHTHSIYWTLAFDVAFAWMAILSLELIPSTCLLDWWTKWMKNNHIDENDQNRLIFIIWM